MIMVFDCAAAEKYICPANDHFKILKQGGLYGNKSIGQAKRKDAVCIR
jgi:hypothetical protein